RWRAATCLREGLLPAHPAWSDSWVERVVAFQEALDDPDGDPHRPRLAELDPALAAAYELHLDGGRLTRWHAEALLLAGEGDGSIAGRCGIPAEVVAAFAEVFFDVRTRLGRTSYVLHQAINVNQDRPEYAVGRAWKMLGYGGGPLAVDFMAAGAEGTGRLDGFAVVGPAAPQDRQTRLRRMVVAALTLELDPAAARRLAPLIEAMGEVDRRANDASCRPIDGSFAAMVAGLDLTPGRPERDEYGLDGGCESRPTGVDPRSDVEHEARADFGPEAPLRRVGS
ncbi:MAG: hypothetical protein LC745_05255, partial [Planctomycetia bacterium]|nr:hypothetical protein [Planctomycetia bacterium]